MSYRNRIKKRRRYWWNKGFICLALVDTIKIRHRSRKVYRCSVRDEAG